MIETIVERHPLKKFLIPEEVADMAEFLISKKAASLSGQIFEMDCGIVSFKITEKMKVKGKEKHALYKWLTDKSNNGVKNSSVKWNFQKYLIDPQGNLVDYFLPTISPLSAKITNHLK
jgi:glutathione peroxidase-family protein